MKLQNAFAVDAPKDDVIALLNDVPRVVPCMPGAQLDETLGPNRWRATVAVKLGPMAMTFDSNVERTRFGDGDIELNVKAREKRGRGSATATVRSEVREQGAGATVDIQTDLALAGAVAQYARGIAQQVASQLVEEFARNLQAEFAPPPTAAAAPEVASPADTRPAPPSRQAHISGGRVLWVAFRRWFASAFARLRGRTS